MSSDELKRWAKTTELPDPIRWGEIEARILLEQGPSPEESEELKKYFPDRGLVLRVLIGLLKRPRFSAVPIRGAALG